MPEATSICLSICDRTGRERRSDQDSKRPLSLEPQHPMSLKPQREHKKSAKRKFSQDHTTTKRPQINPVTQTITAITTLANQLQNNPNKMPLAYYTTFFLLANVNKHYNQEVPALSLQCVPQTVVASNIFQLFRRWTARVWFKHRKYSHPIPHNHASKKSRVQTLQNQGWLHITTTTPQNFQGCALVH